MPESYKPGQRAPVSAQYGVVGPRGGKTGREITAVKGKTLPATERPGQRFVVVDPTKNGAGKKK